MSKKPIHITSFSGVKDFWMISDFTQVYRDSNSLMNCAAVSMSDEDGNPDKTAIITLRTYIENGAKAKDDQKYIVGIRFYAHGDLASIDIISLDKGFHREICYEHMTRMGWPSMNQEMGLAVDQLSETTRTPFAFVGGHLRVENDAQVHFSGSSGDYGDAIFFSDANSIAAYVASVCGIQVIEGDKEKGKLFIEEMLELMLKHKLKENFYEEMVREISDRNPDRTFTSQHIGSLMMMKVVDRSIKENKDLISLMIDEMSGGLGRSIMLNSVAQKIKAKQK